MTRKLLLKKKVTDLPAPNLEDQYSLRLKAVRIFPMVEYLKRSALTLGPYGPKALVYVQIKSVVMFF